MKSWSVLALVCPVCAVLAGKKKPLSVSFHTVYYHLGARAPQATHTISYHILTFLSPPKNPPKLPVGEKEGKNPKIILYRGSGSEGSEEKRGRGGWSE